MVIPSGIRKTFLSFQIVNHYFPFLSFWIFSAVGFFSTVVTSAAGDGLAEAKEEAARAVEEMALAVGHQGPLTSGF